jgi:hypothetical protein
LALDVFSRAVFCHSGTEWLALGLDGRKERDWAQKHERTCHVLCWSIPLCIVIVAFCLDLLGSDGISCSLLPPPHMSARVFSALTTTGLWLGIAYVTFAFVSAQRAIQRGRQLLVDGAFDPSAR